ncbi:MAG: GPR endopeptidase [Oscillospiraceae bacterium]|nr:GPR endopeptidase [Oscillospiraceae bacterium]
MNYRTDLALERQEILEKSEQEGIKVTHWRKENAFVTEIEILNSTGEKSVGKPKGKYITVDLPEFSHESELLDGRLTALSSIIRDLLPKENGSVLVAGLGNENITPDALGPMCAGKIFATRHIREEMKKDLQIDSIRSVASVSTGVLGQTGIETAEYIKSVADIVKPVAIITVDALAARRLSRLGKTVQISNTGIIPGSGVGNARARIDESTMSVPVVSIGVPTVVDGITLINDLTDRRIDAEKIPSDLKETMVTPGDIDTVIERAANLLALAINCALQTEIEPSVFLSLF